MALLGSLGAKNDKSNNWVIRFKQQNDKLTKVHSRFRKESSMYDVSALDVVDYLSKNRIKGDEMVSSSLMRHQSAIIGDVTSFN